MALPAGTTTVPQAFPAKVTGTLSPPVGAATESVTVTVTELVTMLIEAKDQRVLARLKTQLSKLDLLVLDELGYVPATKVGAELLFDVIATAYERSSIMVTTNLPFENWTEVLGSERLTGATLDRLTHRCKIIETKGVSYRLQDAAKRSRIRKS